MKLTETITVNRPPSVVYPLFAALERYHEYGGSTFERTKITDGPVGLGTRFRAVDHWPGRTMRFNVEYVEYEPDRVLAASFSAPMNGGWRAEFAPLEGAATVVTMDMDLRLPGPLRLLAPLARPWINRQGRAFMSSFKDWVERQPASSAA